MAEFIKKKSVENKKNKKSIPIPLVTTIISYFICVVLFSFFGNFNSLFNEDSYLNYKVGDVVKEDVFSNKEIYLIDKEGTDKKKELARTMAFPVFKIYDDITREVNSEFDSFIEEVSQFLQYNPEFEDVDRFIKRFPNIIQPDQFLTIIKDPLFMQNLSYSGNIIQSIMNRGVIFSDDFLEIPPSGIIEIWREIGNDFDKTTVKYNQIPRMDTLSFYIRNELKAEELKLSDIKTVEAFSTFFIKTNCFLDDFQSRLSRDRAASKVKPIELHIAKSEMILEKGYVLTPAIEEKLIAIKSINNRPDFLSLLSPFVFTSFLFAFGIIYFMVFNPKIAGDTQQEILFFSLITICIFISYLIILFVDVSSELPIVIFIPCALFSMLITLLSNKKSGLLFQLIISLSLFYISDFNSEFLFIALFSGITSCMIIEGAEKRIDIIRAGLIQGSAQAFLYLLFQFVIGFSIYSFIWGTIIVFINGFVCGILALGLLPVLEHWMKSCTKFRLIELSDSNANVLKNLLAKAPGTYIHSMNVANLAEMACQEIGGNSLLARVGGLYHDIGKVDQSEYFIENQADINKHDDMKASLSAAVLKAHVKIGVEKGMDLNLPREVVDIIEQHHATSTMKYFFDRALKEKGNTKVNKEDFSYSGPNPQTREAAIVMLADTIEAATRTMKKPSRAKLEKYVWELIMDKFINGELNDCSLTFKDMGFVKSSFVHVLAGHFHTRIEYPDEQKTKEKEPKSE